MNTTLNAPVREPYLYLDKILKDREFFILTTNQDTQFVKIYPDEKVAQIQGDHRYFQCAKPCCDEIWESREIIDSLIEAQGDGLTIPQELIPRCAHCGGEAFPRVRGYGNFLQGTRYQAEYDKISHYIEAHKYKKILLLELGVGRMTPMFIQEPFWHLSALLPHTRYVGVNDKYAFLPSTIEDKGMTITANINDVLRDTRDYLAEKNV